VTTLDFRLLLTLLLTLGIFTPEGIYVNKYFILCDARRSSYVADYSLVLLIHAGELSNTNTYQVCKALQRSYRRELQVLTESTRNMQTFDTADSSRVSWKKSIYLLAVD